MNAARTSFWQMSLRSLLLICPVVAIGCAAMVQPSKAWLLSVAAMSLLIFMAAAVTAVFDRGHRQTFALGFLLCSALHGVTFRWLEEIPTRAILEETYFEYFAGDTAAAHVVGRLEAGDSGELVQALQSALNVHRQATPQLDVDGDFGYRTRLAVEAFQKANGLQVDGVATVATWRALGPAARRSLKLYGIPVSPTTTLAAEQFIEIGGWLATLLVGYVGGHLATAASRRRIST